MNPINYPLDYIITLLIFFAAFYLIDSFWYSVLYALVLLGSLEVIRILGKALVVSATEGKE